MGSSGRRITLLSAVLLAGLLGWATPAAAHTPTGERAADHAAEDLVGIPVSVVEQQTRANARRIAAVTGRVPARALAAVDPADPGRVGSWGAPVDTPVVPVFQAVLPNGKVLMWDSVGDAPLGDYPDQTSTRAAVWDPTDDTVRRVDVTDANIFCSGFSQLADGRVLVAGGNADPEQHGIVATHLFDWRTETWSRGPDLAEARWYPSVTALPDGEASIMGGGPSTGEVFQVDQTLRRLTGYVDFSSRQYQLWGVRPDGRLQRFGPWSSMRTVDPAGEGAVVASRSRDGMTRDYGSFATYDIGKTLVAGGGQLPDGHGGTVPTATATVVDTNHGTTTVTATGSMARPRRQFALTVLADGSVLASGGQERAENPLVDLAHPVLAAERWDPRTGTWTTLASAARVREYHAAATLLPDGRVLTGGGGICAACAAAGYLEKNVEYFTPPYLYRHDGSGELADRPVITGAPSAARYGRAFRVRSPQAARIVSAGLVRLGAATHGDDQSQRFVPVTLHRGRGVLSLLAPRSGAIAPPGHYMLFLIDRDGVPSKAAIVRLGGSDRDVSRPGRR